MLPLPAVSYSVKTQADGITHLPHGLAGASVHETKCHVAGAGLWGECLCTCSIDQLQSQVLACAESLYTFYQPSFASLRYS